MDIQSIVAIVKETDRIFFDRALRNDIQKKGDCDYVTAADLAVSEHLQRRLAETFPEVGFVTEESRDGLFFEEERDYWILDPIDGTTNFMCSLPLCCLSLALCQRGEITMGVIYVPYMGELFTAERGKGAYLNGKRIAVSDTASLSDSLALYEYNAYLKSSAEQAMDYARRLYLSCRDLRTLGSAALEFAYIACGRADVYLGRYLKPWDFAAGMLLVTEAGGKVSGLGRRLELRELNQIVLSGNGTVFEELQRLIKQT